MWNLEILYLGKMLVPPEYLFEGITEPVETPYCGFLLQNGQDNILVDCGVSEDYFVDGKAFGGFPAEGGSSYVIEALAKHELKPGDIDTVLYTHLHNDHAGTCELFPDARHIFQKDEWSNLLNPLPTQKLRKDYDSGVIPKLEKLCTYHIEGDFEIQPGISVYKTPGHTLGHQIITVDTQKGRMVLLGDLCNDYLHFFPELDEFVDMYGNHCKVKRSAVARMGVAEPSSIIYDQYSWYTSVYKAKTLSNNKKELVIPGHEWSLLIGQL
jgi:glyoxylase-like metal-dependent hydrolase (beta-lactamase superfamily II)